jgi:ABC-type glycerol-3-phosphate transport system substrate-binding protein
MNNKVKALIAIVVVAIAGVVVVQQQSGGDVTLTLATVNNGQMKDMESLKSEFEADNPTYVLLLLQMLLTKLDSMTSSQSVHTKSHSGELMVG